MAKYSQPFSFTVQGPEWLEEWL